MVQTLVNNVLASFDYVVETSFWLKKKPSPFVKFRRQTKPFLFRRRRHKLTPVYLLRSITNRPVIDRVTPHPHHYSCPSFTSTPSISERVRERTTRSFLQPPDLNLSPLRTPLRTNTPFHRSSRTLPVVVLRFPLPDRRRPRSRIPRSPTLRVQE